MHFKWISFACLLYRVVCGIGVTFIQPVYYSSLFSHERIYGYPNDFERFVSVYSIFICRSCNVHQIFGLIPWLCLMYFHPSAYFFYVNRIREILFNTAHISSPVHNFCWNLFLVHYWIRMDFQYAKDLLWLQQSNYLKGWLLVPFIWFLQLFWKRRVLRWGRRVRGWFCKVKFVGHGVVGWARWITHIPLIFLYFPFFLFFIYLFFKKNK